MSFTELEGIVKVRLHGRVRDFGIIAEPEGLFLRGRARSYYAKQLAQHTVMEVTAMRIVANDIEVVCGDKA